MTKLVYFAWVREKVGLAEEEATLPPEVATVGDLLLYLRARGDGFAEAFAEPETIRVALDRVHAFPEDPLAGAREIALFPPMTGG
ncbi:molybdopterin converting factor subunit 1 [Methylobrevis albus]|uniref:Molybdopterin converting factor subunit 1 n=1 Tax=Methylobrevis albus TaxID=2793297 RepID=A0A931I393_9HYPH|nr:molybdopterin converting factor subunit 1 [Methylobrevis albus]MBH0238503.1 molybdopterin converting factor subunit 1 [Methylobrevis albus]